MTKIDTYIKQLNILYEDNHLLVVEKFRDVLSQQDETNDIAMTDIIRNTLKWNIKSQEMFTLV